MDINTTTDTSPQFGKQNTKEKIFKILNLSVPILMVIFLFFSPIPHTTSIKEVCFYGSVIIVLILICFKKIDFSLKSPLTLPFALFTAWAFIGLFFALDKGNSLHDFCAHLLKYLVLYYILINSFNSRKRLICLSWVIILSGAIFSSGAIWHFYYYLEHNIQKRLGENLGLLYAINVIGYLLVISTIFSIRMFLDTKKPFPRYAFALTGIISGCASMLTGSRGTWLALIVAIGILLIKRKKILVYGIAIFIIASLALPSSGNRIIHGEFKDRLIAYFYSLEFIKEHPIIGSGFAKDTYSTENLSNIEKYKSKIPQRYRSLTYLWPPHNMLLFIAVRLGLIGLMLFIYILFKPVSMCLNLARYEENEFTLNWALCLLSALTVILIKGLFEPMFTHFVDILFYTILAMITILWNLNRRRARET